jgi:hypothetical protein
LFADCFRFLHQIDHNNQEIQQLNKQVEAKNEQNESLNQLLKSFQDRLKAKEEVHLQSLEHQKNIYEEVQAIIGREMQGLNKEIASNTKAMQKTANGKESGLSNDPSKQDTTPKFKHRKNNKK